MSLESCDGKIYRDGELIATLIDMNDPPRTDLVEEWVRKVADAANARLDWHQEAGPHVMHLGDDDSYSRAIAQLRAHHGQLGIRIQKVFPRGRISPLRRDR